MGKPIDIELCKQLFTYNEETGELISKVSRGAIAKGSAVGSPSKSTGGHLSTAIKGQKYYVHRIIYSMVHKVDISNLVIDHIDRDPTNNRIDNLRACTQMINGSNRASCDDPAYCYFSKGRWHAAVRIEGEITYLGRFDTKAEASKVSHTFKQNYEQAREEISQIL